MKAVIVTISILLASSLAYHDPDLNYHLSQVQGAVDCGPSGQGYSYPAPTVQLARAPAAPVLQLANAPAAPAYLYSADATYHAVAATAPQAYQRPLVTQPAYSSQTTQKEFHGYRTSAGLSSAGSGSITPSATYAQAPILSKITAAPLIAKYSIAPVKSAYTAQNSYAGPYSSAPTSYSQSSGPVVSQVYAAPTVRYEVSPALKVQQPSRQYLPPVSQPAPAVTQALATNVAQTTQVVAPAKYFAPAPRQPLQAVSQVQHGQYFAPASQHQYARVGALHQQVSLSSPVVNQVQHVAQAIQYAAPAVQYAAPAVQYAAPAVQYAAPVAQYAAPVAQYSVPVTKYSSNVQYASPVQVSHAAAALQVTKVAAPAQTLVSHGKQLLTAGQTKNVHTEFIENYDAHPRYAYEYAVNDPHTGDIKQQKEERDGEVVKGQYSLVEPDGSVRTVDYIADWATGFHANVRNSKDRQH